MKVHDISYIEKDNEIKYEEFEKIKIEKSQLKDNKGFDDQLEFEKKYYLSIF